LLVDCLIRWELIKPNLLQRIVLRLYEQFDSIMINAISPNVVCWWFHSSKCLTNNIVALESTTKCNLPNLITFSHSPFGLNVTKLIPNWAWRSVTEAMQCHPKSLYMYWQELQVLLKLINRNSSSNMNTLFIRTKTIINHKEHCGKICTRNTWNDLLRLSPNLEPSITFRWGK